MPHRHAWTLIPLAAAAALGAAACGPPRCNAVGCPTDGGDVLTDAPRTDAPTDAPPADAPADAPPADAPGDAGTITSLAIEPANPTIESRDGVGATQAFRVFGVGDGGARVELPTGTWSLEHARLGAVSAAGVFAANGVAGGTVRLDVEAAVAGTVLRASTTVTARVAWTYASPGVPVSVGEARFSAAPVADAARAPRVLYPLDGAVMPNNVGAPDVQWEGGNTSDLLRVRVERPNARVTAYLLHSGGGFASDFPVPADAWRSLAESDAGEPVRFYVDRYDAARREVVSGVAPAGVNLSQGSTYGAVYYWEVQPGDGVGSRIARIRPDAPARENLIPFPPSATTGGAQCLGCHAVSRDGRYLSAQVGLHTATVFDLTADLSAAPAPSVFPLHTTDYGSSSFSPDNSRMVVGIYQGGITPSLDRNLLGMIDPLTGMSVAATGLPSAGASSPSWSPDGNAVAYIAGGFDSPFGASRGDLVLLPRTGPDAFGAPSTLHQGSALASAPEGGDADARASWSPDSRRIAFQHGPSSISGQGGETNPGGIYLVAAAGGPAVRLDTAMGGGRSADAYWPTFSPFTTAGAAGHRYYWLAFYSLRDYGNAQAGTRGARRRQLWVTAIDADAPAGADPSSVPYWLPGQDTGSGNMAAYWAALACRATSEECSVSSECCSGSCRPDAATPGRFTCQPPPPAECRQRGQTCDATGDCCAGRGLECTAHVCEEPPPG